MVNTEEIEIDNKLLPDEDQLIVLLPQNYLECNDVEQFFYNEEIKTLSKMFSSGNLENYKMKIKGNAIDNYKAQKSGHIIIPSLFVSGLIMSENPELVSVAMSVIANYATTLLKGIPKRKQNVKFKIINKNHKTKKTSKIEYEGNVEGINELTKILKEINK